MSQLSLAQFASTLGKYKYTLASVFVYWSGLAACMFFLMLFVIVVMLRQTLLIQHQSYHTLYKMKSFGPLQPTARHSKTIWSATVHTIW